LKRVLLYANRLLLATSAIVLTGSVICFALTVAFGEWNTTATLYWFTFSEHIYDDLMETTVLAFLIIGVLFVILMGISRLLAQATPYSRIGARAVLLTFLAGILMCGTYFVRFIFVGPFGYWEHMQTVSMADHVYHLLHFTHDPTELHFYRFYECDRFDLFCQELYSTSPLGSSVKPSDDRILLVTASSAKTVSLQIYGDVVYTRHVP